MLTNAALAKSLQKKDVAIKNFSFLPLGTTASFYRLFPYATNFFELIFSNSLIPVIINNTDHAQLTGLKNDFYMTGLYNQTLLKKAPDYINQNSKNRVFIYLHLLMPHDPIHFGNEINLKEYNLSNYYEYWKFTNGKVTALLKALDYLDKYRVIITGDHGYRSDKAINPHNTFTAFYGFDSCNLKKINSVQDIGLLINNSFSQ
jgi:hypothetical protein